MEPRGGVCGGRARGWRSRLQHAGRQCAGEIALSKARTPGAQVGRWLCRVAWAACTGGHGGVPRVSGLAGPGVGAGTGCVGGRPLCRPDVLRHHPAGCFGTLAGAPGTRGGRRHRWTVAARDVSMGRQAAARRQAGRGQLPHGAQARGDGVQAGAVAPAGARRPPGRCHGGIGGVRGVVCAGPGTACTARSFHVGFLLGACRT